MLIPKLSRRVLFLAGGIILAAGLLLFRLGTLPHGISANEVTQGGAPPLNSLLRDPFHLPLTLMHIVLFHLHHGSLFWMRLPGVILGLLTVICFAAVAYFWFGVRTALLSTVLFVCSAWTLHASRVATYDVLYLLALPLLLLTNTLLYRYHDKGRIVCAALFCWGVLLFIPGLVWLVVANCLLQIRDLAEIWEHYSKWRQRFVGLLSAVWLLPLLGWALAHGHRWYWLGVHKPFVINDFPRQLVAVPVHLFVRGPKYPDLWLGRLPILDVFTLACCMIGIYFYLRHLGAYRSRLLAVYAVLGTLLVALQGPVGLSLLVPLLYLGAATGIAYLLREWLHTFPFNPLARWVGIGLILLAIAISCIYNVRAYFVAWPHNPDTRAAFHSPA